MSIKKVNLLVAVVMILSLLAGCASPAQPEAPAAPAEGKKIRIGVSMLFDDLWLTTLRDAISAYAATQPDVELVMVDSKEDVATQLGQVENFVSQKLDAIVLIPPDTNATDPVIKAAQDAGIPLVFINRKPANLPAGIPYVGSDSIVAGRLQAEWLAEKLGGKGNVVVMQGNLAQEAAQQRTAGFHEVFEKYPDIKIIKEDTANWSRDQGLALMENWLSTGEQIDAVASNNDEMTIGALQAIDAAGLLGKILVGGVDASADALSEMSKGRLNVTVFQNAAGQGEGGIKAAISLARGETVPDYVDIPYELVTPENCGDYMDGCAPAGAAAAPADAEPIRIGVSMLFDDLWLTTLRDAISAYAETQPGVELIMVDSKEDVATQLGQVENFVSQNVDAIILIPPDTSATGPAIKAAQDAGIPLVFINRKPSELPAGIPYVGSDSIVAGRLQAEWLAEKLGGKGNVVVMQGNLAQEAAQQRTAGFHEVFEKYPDIKIIKEDTANWSRDQGLALMENWLSTGEQIDAVASNNDEMAIGALQAIDAAGLLGKILVGGVDASPDALAEMDEGRLNVTVFQNAAGQGEGGIKAAISLARGETVPDYVDIPYELVTPENYKDYMK